MPLVPLLLTGIKVGLFFTHLVRSFTCLLPLLNPPNHQKTVQEVRLDNIRQKRGLALLVDQSYNVITNVSFPL